MVFLGKSKNKNSKSNNQLLIMCLPVLLKVFIFSYLPMAGIVIAFVDLDYKKGIFKSLFVGFDNFDFSLNL